MDKETNNAFHTFIGGLAVGLTLLYFGGWSIAWNDFISTKKALYIGHGLAIEFNGRYYGLLFDSRFYDSAVISWILGFVALTSISIGLKSLNSESEEEDGNGDGDGDKYEDEKK